MKQWGYCSEIKVTRHVFDGNERQIYDKKRKKPAKMQLTGNNYSINCPILHGIIDIDKINGQSKILFDIIP